MYSFAQHFDVFKKRLREFHNDDRNDIYCRAQRRATPRYSRLVGEVMEARMGDVVNLKRFKKRADRNQAEREAEANRARFGRTKPERDANEIRIKRANNALDQHRIDGEDAT
jgi:Domain of unknown function (DUF4169)